MKENLAGLVGALLLMTALVGGLGLLVVPEVVSRTAYALSFLCGCWMYGITGYRAGVRDATVEIDKMMDSPLFTEKLP